MLRVLYPDVQPFVINETTIHTLGHSLLRRGTTELDTGTP